jgi:ATP-binding cassette subfamily D (ALD) protein 4
MGEEEREPLLSPRAANVLTSQASEMDDGATADKKTGSQRLRRREKQHGFNVLFVKRFLRLVRVVFPRVCCKSLLLLAILMLTQSAVEYNVYLTGLIPSQFIYVLDTRDMSGFKRALWMSTVTVVSVSICKSAGLLVSGLLYVRGRGLIVRRLHQLYFRGINYYHVNVTDHSIDNPDQRITQDVDKFCDQMTQVLPNIILSPAIIAYYTYKTFQSMGYLGPLCIYAYFVASSVISKLLVGSIAPMVVRQEKLEGDFRCCFCLPFV